MILISPLTVPSYLSLKIDRQIRFFRQNIYIKFDRWIKPLHFYTTVELHLRMKWQRWVCKALKFITLDPPLETYIVGKVLTPSLDR